MWPLSLAVSLLVFFRGRQLKAALVSVHLQFQRTECELEETGRCQCYRLNVISMQGSSNCRGQTNRIFMQMLSAEQQDGGRSGKWCADGDKLTALKDGNFVSLRQRPKYFGDRILIFI